METPGKSPRRRAGAAVHIGKARARTVATRLGMGLREARQGAGMTQSELAAKAGVSQSRESELERGRGAGASIAAWSCLAAAAGEQFVGFLERSPGADRPRDMEHLRRQSALIELATVGGWSALPELAIDPGPGRSRSIDVALVRPQTGEAVVAEIWDWFDDVGASLRGLDAKVAALSARLAVEPPRSRSHAESAGGIGARPPSDWRVRGLFVVRGTRRNRSLVAELRPLFAARFDGSSVGWIRALGSHAAAMPDGHGFVWSDRHVRLTPSRLARPGS
jgi:transcriptional regulator with XRE-family HTH domain